MAKAFFDEQAEQSQVKSQIVAKYFWAWAQVMLSVQKRKNIKNPRIAYIDLFAGPGRYKNGAKSTPLLILEQAIQDSERAKSLVTLFNDKEPDNTSTLQQEIEKIPGYQNLKYKPEIQTNEVGNEIVKMFESVELIPTLFFVDPWGYKGLSLRLVNSVLKDWGCECVFFFNYNRINAGLSNSLVREHMEALFGPERAEELSQELSGLLPAERELLIIERLCEALIEMGGKFVLPFCFKDGTGKRTSHHLIFVSKHSLGYDIMKGVMASESSAKTQGVPSFEYNPADRKYKLLFEFSRPLDDLEDMLLEKFAGRRLTMEQVFELHNYGTPYIKPNYKSILLKMEMEGKITTDKHYSQRPKRKGEPTFADTVLVSFPRRGKSK